MLCFSDMTYCPFKKCIYFDICHRALTEKVQIDAISNGYPICQFIDKPSCFEDDK
jgi:hypothetical protein